MAQVIPNPEKISYDMTAILFGSLLRKMLLISHLAVVKKLMNSNMFAGTTTCVPTLPSTSTAPSYQLPR
jgi:hypothetical protein